MSLQILGGVFKGRRLASPKTDKTRPTLAIVRKALFDILQNSIVEAEVLDLCAGSGGIGFEALSRGAQRVVFVEKEKAALRCLHDNMASLQSEHKCQVMGYDAFLALRKLASAKQQFDLIYVDPPYAHTHTLKELVLLIDQLGLLKQEGSLFAEEDVRGELSSLSLPTLRLVNTRRFSDSLLHQFRLN